MLHANHTNVPHRIHILLRWNVSKQFFFILKYLSSFIACGTSIIRIVTEVIAFITELFAKTRLIRIHAKYNTSNDKRYMFHSSSHLLSQSRQRTSMPFQMQHFNAFLFGNWKFVVRSEYAIYIRGNLIFWVFICPYHRALQKHFHTAI